MLRSDCPQWLFPTFMRSLRDAGSSASEDEISSAGHRLIDLWMSPGRAYHGIKHLCSLLGRIGEIVEQTHNPELVMLAAFYHGTEFHTDTDATYAHRGGEDEEGSARIAEKELTKLGVPPSAIEKVTTLIRQLPRRHSADTDIDALTLSDAHLGSLAVEPQRYRTYLDEIAAEYSHIPLDDFLRARTEIVTRLLDRKKIFGSPLGTKWEAQARENLHAELERITSRKNVAPTIESEPIKRSPAPLAEDVTEDGSSSLENVPVIHAKLSDSQEEKVRKRAERDSIARRIQERAKTRGVDVSAPTPVSAPSASTPDFSSHASETSGMEREPDE